MSIFQELVKDLFKTFRIDHNIPKCITIWVRSSLFYLNQPDRHVLLITIGITNVVILLNFLGE
jgi:hypothetical protein